MTPRLVDCTKCRKPLPPVLYNAQELRTCPSCKALSQVEIFPAALRAPTPSAAPDGAASEGEASCFYHPDRKAVLACESCGRFLCGLCDLELHGAHICSACLKTGKQKGRLKKLENRRTLYDSLALAVAVYPMLLAWPSIIGAPIALYIAIRYWNAPSSVVPRSKWRAILAIIIALLTIAGWIALLTFVTQAASRK